MMKTFAFVTSSESWIELLAGAAIFEAESGFGGKLGQVYGQLEVSNAEGW